ncbi:hypothetical protein EDB83DRAFT_2373906 [Lactarius deliciosus]|nr:hypothetical protein EDB83DRAFT_2373906 [Lactarius deliciosus]
MATCRYLVKTTAKQTSTKKHGQRCREAHCRPSRPGLLQNQPASRRSTSLRSRVASRCMSKTPLFLSFPSESNPSEPHPRQCDRDRDHEPLDIISVNTPSSSSSPPPPPRAACARPRNGVDRQLMAYVLIPPFLPGVRKSDYAPSKATSPDTSTLDRR